MTGSVNRVGKLRVVEPMPCSHQNLARLLCVCDCGKEIVLYKKAFESGRITSCGCARHKEKPNARPNHAGQD